MKIKEFLKELHRRHVWKVAVAYTATAVVLLEVLTHLFHNFEAPHWVLKVITTLLIAGLPLACLAAWGFEFKDGMLQPLPPPPSSEGAPSRDAPAAKGRPGPFVVGLVLAAVLAGIALVQWRGPVPGDGSGKTATPVVIVMDTGAPRGVYDEDVRKAGGTNADTLTEALRDLPVLLQKETVGATWAREDQILKQTPSLILIHRSSFYHAMAEEFGFGYPGDPGFDAARAKALYEISQNKLMAMLGYVAMASPGTLFVAYGRGTGGDWDNDQDRARWVAQVEGRFPVVKGRITAIGIPGGLAGGSMHDEMTQQMFRQLVRKLLKLDGEGGQR
jgi:hypothetical protein